MRLICANCGAAYEVPASAIPEAGREVKCSACGHAWLQRAAGAAPRRPVDPQALSILREEAAREAMARGAATAPARPGTADVAADEGPEPAAPVHERGGDGILAPARLAEDRRNESASPTAGRIENPVKVSAFSSPVPVEDDAGNEAAPAAEHAAPAPAGDNAALRDLLSADPVIPESLPDMGSVSMFHPQPEESHPWREEAGLRPAQEAGGPPAQEMRLLSPGGDDAAQEKGRPPAEEQRPHPAQETPHPAPTTGAPSAMIRPEAPQDPASVPAAGVAAAAATGATATAGAQADVPPAPLPGDLAAAPVADLGDRSSLPSAAIVPPPRTEDRPTRPLPDPQEANSTLMPVAEARRGRFGLGFVLALLLVGLLAGLYVVAPGLRDDAPAAAPYLDAYVSTIDAARLWLDRTAAPLLDRLRP